MATSGDFHMATDIWARSSTASWVGSSGLPR
jgi:hypothetical protein